MQYMEEGAFDVQGHALVNLPGGLEKPPNGFFFGFRLWGCVTFDRISYLLLSFPNNHDSACYNSSVSVVSEVQ